jgi:hypothetical protein
MSKMVIFGHFWGYENDPFLGSLFWPKMALFCHIYLIL